MDGAVFAHSVPLCRRGDRPIEVLLTPFGFPSLRNHDRSQYRSAARAVRLNA
jgi:hypothetical protein